MVGVSRYDVKEYVDSLERVEQLLKGVNNAIDACVHYVTKLCKGYKRAKPTDEEITYPYYYLQVLNHIQGKVRELIAHIEADKSALQPYLPPEQK